MQDDIRSDTQNRALHLWFQHIADTLNEAGAEQKITLGTVEVPWEKESVKWIFKKIAHAQIDKWETHKMTKEELSKVQETMNRFLAEKGLHIPFPSLDLLEEELRKQDEKPTI